MQPVYTQNPSFAHEGVYISEIPAPGQVLGVESHNVVGITGECVRGPKDRAIDVTSAGRFDAIYGARDRGNGGSIVGKIWQALQNKEFGKLVIVRAVAADAVIASFTLETAAGGGGTAVLRVDAANQGAWGNDVAWKVEAASDGVGTHFDLLIRYLGSINRLKNININSGTDDNTASVIATVWDDDTKLISLTKLANGRPNNSAASVDGADTDGFTLLGQTVPAYTSVVGAEGTIADTDFTSAGRALEVLAGTKGVGVKFIAERMSAALKAKVATLAASSSDCVWLIGADAETTSKATAVTDVASYRSKRITYCFDHVNTFDFTTNLLMTTRPESWMAVILARTAPETHPGEEGAKSFLAGVTGLYNEALSVIDYEDLRRAGISALEKDEGFGFVSALVTDLTEQELTLRRIKDFLLITSAAAVKSFVKKPNTPELRQQMHGVLSGFYGGLKKAKRIVEDFFIDMEALNSPSSRAAGIEKPFIKIKTFPYALFIHLNAEIGPGVTFAGLRAA